MTLVNSASKVSEAATEGAGLEQLYDQHRSGAETSIRDLFETLILGLKSAGHETRHEISPSLSNLVQAHERLLRHPDVFYAASFVLEANVPLMSETKRTIVEIREILARTTVQISGTLGILDNDLKKDLKNAEESDWKIRLEQAGDQILALADLIKSKTRPVPAIPMLAQNGPTTP